MRPRYPAHIRQLKANLESARKWRRVHRRQCYKCTQAAKAGRPELGCDTGWQFAKDESRWARALERARCPELVMAGDQLALF
jgi:hypothetical protein